MAQKKKLGSWWKVAILIILILGLYLNRAYAYFFDYLDQHSIEPANESAQSDPYRQLIFNDELSQNSAYVALGDSLTFGVGVSDSTQTFPADLGDLIQQKQPIHYYNLGIPGAKTDQLINIELPMVQKLHPTYITLLIGINDVLDLQSAATFQKNYQLILDQITQNPQTKVIVLNIPDLTNSKVMLPPYNYLVNLRINQFNSIISKLVAEKEKTFSNLIFINLYDQTKSQFMADPTLFSSDYFHPSSKGYQLWSQIIDASLSH